MSLDAALKAEDNRAFNPPNTDFNESVHAEAVEDALDDIMDDNYAVLLTLTDFLDADHVESSLKALVNTRLLDDDQAMLSVAKGLASMLLDEIRNRAESRGS